MMKQISYEELKEKLKKILEEIEIEIPVPVEENAVVRDKKERDMVFDP